MKNRILDAVMGLCVGDALGVPVEFMSRRSLKLNPVISMREYGTYHKPRGTWSDDTSMTLCFLDSLATGIDYDDIMKKFVLWYKEGHYTQYGEAFDVGNGTREAILRYISKVEPLCCGGRDEFNNGNGSLMRILPLLFYLRSNYGENFYMKDEAFDQIHKISALTHGHPRSQMACGIYLTVATMLMDETCVNVAVKKGMDKVIKFYADNEIYKDEIALFMRLQSETFEALPESEIRSSGYVVDTLEAAIWCLLKSNSYAECVLMAVNLGEDTDTVAAVAGGLAGLYYGLGQIPVEWVDAIPGREMIVGLSEQLYKSLLRECILEITQFIPYLKRMRGQTVCNYRNGYPVYDQSLLEFVDAVERSNLMVHDYLRIISEYGINHFDEIADRLKEANIELTLAILTGLVRQERFGEGLWKEAVEKELFLSALVRLETFV